MPECTCRGTNPDCFKCGGWGWIGDPVVKDQGKAPVPTGPPAELSSKTLKNVKNKNKHITIRQCPYCGNNVTNLDRHVAILHKNKWGEYAKTSNRKKLLEYYAHEKEYSKRKHCPHCGIKVLNLDNHIRFTHLDKKGNLLKKSIASNLAKNKNFVKPKHSIKTENKSTLVRCQYCNALINREVLCIHIQNDHKKEILIKNTINNKAVNNNLTKCQYCNVLINENILYLHIRNDHKDIINEFFIKNTKDNKAVSNNLTT
jgi:hypothetical protein